MVARRTPPLLEPSRSPAVREAARSAGGKKSESDESFMDPMLLPALGAMAEWLRSGLQSRLHRFDSGWRLLESSLKSFQKSCTEVGAALPDRVGGANDSWDRGQTDLPKGGYRHPLAEVLAADLSECV